MDYQHVPYTAYLAETLATLVDSGLLLVTRGADGSLNVMTIGWATVGSSWGRPVLTVLVRPSRHSHQLLEETGEFTVCVPTPEMWQIAEMCGNWSGRSHDKFRELSLIPVTSVRVAVPGISGCSVIYECRSIHSDDLVPAQLAPDLLPSYYPAGDFHRVYFGEILAVRALTDARRPIPRASETQAQPGTMFRTITRISRPVRREGAPRYLRYTLTSFAATVILTRLFLSLTDQPQLGGGTLHIAHVLWGGLLLFVAALLPLVFSNRWIFVLDGILSGIGIGLFIQRSVSEGGNTWYVIRLVLEGAVGIFLVAGARDLAFGRDQRGVDLSHLGLLLSLTTVNLLVFYFDQFRAITDTLLQFGGLLMVNYYRDRFASRGPSQGYLTL